MSWLISLMVLASLMTTTTSLGMSPFNNQMFSLDVVSSGLLWLTSGVIISSVISFYSLSTVFLWGVLYILLIMIFMSSILIYFYILFEMSLIPILLMILSQGNQPERLSAGTYLLLYTFIISVPYLSIMLLFTGMEQNFSMMTNFTMMSVLSYTLLLPFLIKMPVFGAHFWLPKAHVEANTGGSMVLAGLLLKLGSYGAVRISEFTSMNMYLAWSAPTWIVLSLLSSVVTFMQTDLKKLIAYSSVTHMTLLVIGIISGIKLLTVSVIILSLTHGWVAMGLFLQAGLVSHGTNSRLGYMLSSEAILHWIVIIFSILLVANASVPPMPSFFSELFLILSALSMSGNLTLWVIMLSVIVCYYNSFLFLAVSHYKSLSIIPSSFKLTDGSYMFIVFSMNMNCLLWVILS